MLWTTILGLATAGPLQDPELLPLTAETQYELKANLQAVAGQPVHVYQRTFSDPLELNRFVQLAQRGAPGTDVVLFQVDVDLDGRIDALQMSRRMDAQQLHGLTYAVERPLWLDTNADGVADRMAVTGGLPEVTRTASR